jgi:hypothetical protein
MISDDVGLMQTPQIKDYMVLHLRKQNSSNIALVRTNQTSKELDGFFGTNSSAQK